MKYILHFFITPLFLLTSCFEDFKGIRNNSLNERVFENTVTGRIFGKKGEEIAIFKFIYLSDISLSSKNKDEDNTDIFLMSIYFIDGKTTLEQTKYIIRLNDSRPEKIEKIDPTNSILGDIKLLNPWFGNYALYFRKWDSNDFKISFELENFDKVQLSLLKGSEDRRDYPAIIDKLHNLR
jgi:hypothetical protein